MLVTIKLAKRLKTSVRAATLTAAVSLWALIIKLKLFMVP
jgi:hypothetical protein